MDPDAVLYIHLLGPWPKMHNLKTESIVTEGTENREAYIWATRLDQPASCSLEIVISWHFLDIDQNDEDHYVTVTLETIYYNGSAYKRIAIPIKVNMLIDPGDTFESARYSLWDGVHSESLDENDKVDIYAIPFRHDGSTIKINLTVPQNADFGLYLYDDKGVDVANSTNGVGISEMITYIDQTVKDIGLNYAPWWYIKVERVTGRGNYKLEINRVWRAK
jgi:hypothetical protein